MAAMRARYLYLLIGYTFLYAVVAVFSWAFGFYEEGKELAAAISLGLLNIPLLYYLLVFKHVQRRFGRQLAYFAGVVLLTVPIVNISTMTGGYESGNNIAYIILVYLSAMLGRGLPLTLIWTQVLVYTMVVSGYLPGLGDPAYGGVVVIACIIAGIAGWLTFRRFYVKEDPEADRLAEMLRAQELQSEGVIAAISDGVVIVNRDGIAVHANQRFLDMIALKREELVGKHYSEIVSSRIQIIASSSATPRIGQNVVHVMDTGEPITIDSVTAEYIDGSGTVDFSISISPLKNDDGDISAVLVMAKDITSLMHLQRMKDALISTASHELRTPITVIAGYADLLLGNAGGGELNDKQRHYLERTKETTTQLTEMVNDMLDMSRLESGQRNDNPVATNVMRLLESMTEGRISQFASKNLTLHLDAKPIRVYADKNRLEQVVGNLLSNAFKFTPENGKVTLAAREVDGMCEISVTDTGPGIPDEHLQDIFDKFIKLDDSGSLPGAGLGLAIAKNIVDNWNGTITAENMDKGGARFRFTVPLERKDKQEKEEEHENSHH